MQQRRTRRDVVAGAFGLVGALAAGADVLGFAVGADAARADTPAPSDSELLSKSLEVERLMVVSYRRVLDSAALTPGVRRVLAPFLGHEQAHLAAVARQLSALGGAAPTDALSVKAADALIAQHHVDGSLKRLHTQSQCLKLLVDLESVAEGAHYTPIKDLRSDALLRMSAQIMACEAQHWTVVSGLRNPGQYVKAIPWPYVFGTK